MSITDPTVFTRGTKSRGKQTHVLSLAGWVGCAGPLVKPRDHLLSWDMEHNNPVLKVASANGRPKFTFDMKSGIGDLQVRSRNQGPPSLTSMIHRLRAMESRRSSLSSTCANSPSQVRTSSRPSAPASDGSKGPKVPTRPWLSG